LIGSVGCSLSVWGFCIRGLCDAVFGVGFVQIAYAFVFVGVDNAYPVSKVCVGEDLCMCGGSVFSLDSGTGVHCSVISKDFCISLVPCSLYMGFW
jgi:L-aminopeptidase/D-esterase-like protein